VDYSAFEDTELLQLMAQEDVNALSELYDRYGRMVFSLALKITKDHRSSEEITQDVFYRIWERAYSYIKEKARVRTWILTVARNRAIDVYRINKRDRTISAERIPFEISSKERENFHECVEQRQIVWEAVSSLSSKQRKPLELAFYQGYSHSEIAKILGEPLGTVKTRIRTGLQKLRSKLKDLEKNK
jgi:RNA polymerase sigma-70 factor (ECF subfamily)